MKVRRVIKWTFAGLTLSVLVGAGAVYMLANWTPADYQPVVIVPAERETVRAEMESKLSVAFDPTAIATGDIARLGVAENVHTEEVVMVDEATGEKKVMVKTTFAMPLSAKELNNWVGSMPEESMASLNNAGVSEPALSVSKDRVTFYANVKKFDKVVGIDLDFKFDESGKAVAKLDSSKVGKLKIPDEIMNEYKGRLVEAAKKNIGDLSSKAGKLVGGKTGPLAASAARSLGPKLGDALAGKPVSLDIKHESGSVRIRGVKAVKGKLTLDVVSLQDKDAVERAQAQAALANVPADKADALDKVAPTPADKADALDKAAPTLVDKARQIADATE